MNSNLVGPELEDTDLTQNVQETDIRSRKLKQEFPEVLKTLWQFFSSKDDPPRHLKGLLKASNRKFTEESAELTKPVPLCEPAQGLEEAIETLKTSLAAIETTIRLHKEEM